MWRAIKQWQVAISLPATYFTASLLLVTLQDWLAICCVPVLDKWPIPFYTVKSHDVCDLHTCDYLLISDASMP